MTDDLQNSDVSWEPLFDQLAPRLGERRQRLLAAAFCRHLDSHIEDAAVHDAIATTERFVANQATVADLERTRKMCRDLASRCGHEALTLADRGEEHASQRAQLRSDLAWLGAFLTAGQFDVKTIAARATLALRAAQRLQHPDLAGDFERHQGERQKFALLDIAGPLDGRAVFEASWQTSTVLALLKSMTTTGAFELMPILADALEDAGCTDAAILDHCRSAVPHVRGCWVMQGLQAGI